MPVGNYEFVPDTSRWVEVLRVAGGVEFRSFGKLDVAGNFVADKNWLNIKGILVSAPNSMLLNVSGMGTVYEFRSGALIKGKIDDKTRNFVPEVGSKVIDFQDYLKNYRAGIDPQIWNLPGTLRKKEPPKPVPDAKTPGSGAGVLPGRGGGGSGGGGRGGGRGSGGAPPEACPSFGDYGNGSLISRLAAGAVVNLGAAVVLLPQASVPAGEYELVPDTNRWVEVKRWDGDQIYWSIGRLDAVGNFVPDEEYFNRTGPKTKAPPNVTLLNRDGMGAVYEYRSGALVKGRINGMLNFVPEVGSTVIDFKDYKYGPGALPIWNLPGSFKKK